MTRFLIAKSLALVTGSLMSFLYAGFALPIMFSYLTSANLIIFAGASTQLARVVVAFLYGRLRRASIVTLFSYFSIEVFLLPALGVLTLLTGDTGYVTVLKDLFTVWLPMLPVSLAPFLVTRYALSMSQREKLSRILPSGVVLFGLLAFVLNIYGQSSLSNITANLLGAVGSGFGTGLQGVQSAGTSAALIAVGIYLVLMLYSVTQDGQGIFERTKVLGLALAGGLLTLAASIGITLLLPSSVYILALPTLVVTGLVVLATRGT